MSAFVAGDAAEFRAKSRSATLGGRMADACRAGGVPTRRENYLYRLLILPQLVGLVGVTTTSLIS